MHNHPQQVTIGDVCINLTAIAFVRHLADDEVGIAFFAGHYTLHGDEARTFWRFYTSTINGTKKLTPQPSQEE